MHRVVQQALVRTPGLGDVAHQAHAAHRAPVGGGDARRLELEPAIAVVGLAKAEIGADATARALLDRPEHQPEALAVGDVQVLGEVVDLGRELAGGEAERSLDHRVHLDLVAARVPFPHGRPAPSMASERVCSSVGAAP